MITIRGYILHFPCSFPTEEKKNTSLQKYAMQDPSAHFRSRFPRQNSKIFCITWTIYYWWLTVGFQLTADGVGASKVPANWLSWSFACMSAVFLKFASLRSEYSTKWLPISLVGICRSSFWGMGWGMGPFFFFLQVLAMGDFCLTWWLNPVFWKEQHWDRYHIKDHVSRECGVRLHNFGGNGNLKITECSSEWCGHGKSKLRLFLHADERWSKID